MNSKSKCQTCDNGICTNRCQEQVYAVWCDETFCEIEEAEWYLSFKSDDFEQVPESEVIKRGLIE